MRKVNSLHFSISPFFQLGDFVICGLFSNNNNNRSGLVGVCVCISTFCEWDVVLAPCFVTRGRLISNVFRECIDVQKNPRTTCNNSKDVRFKFILNDSRNFISKPDLIIVE